VYRNASKSGGRRCRVLEGGETVARKVGGQLAGAIATHRGSRTLVTGEKGQRDAMSRAGESSMTGRQCRQRGEPKKDWSPGFKGLREKVKESGDCQAGRNVG